MTPIANRERSPHPGTPWNFRAASLDELYTVWKASAGSLEWRCLFTLPPWLSSWWKFFGKGDGLRLLLVEGPDGPTGFAPLRIRGDTAMFAGSPDVCDYLDIVTAPDTADGFARALFAHLRNTGIRELVFNSVRKDAVVWTDLMPIARTAGWDVSCEQEGISFEIDLPHTWEAYLSQLNGKQRHELRRKLRRLHEAGDIQFRLIDSADDMADAFDVFIDLFKSGHTEKAAFMTDPMSGFFRALGVAFTEERMFKLGMLSLNGTAVSATMCFDYRSTRYLYNSGYAPDCKSLSVGLLCKVLSIQNAIAGGLSCYDLLKGEEIYKQRLGGKPRAIYRCRIKLP